MCSTQKEKNEYRELTEFEGHYEYIGDTTLDLVASEFDTTSMLYWTMPNTL
mgnify:CR=1 FL=1